MLRYRLMAAILGLPLIIVLLWLNYYLRSLGSPDDFPLMCLVLLIAGISGWEVSQVLRHRFPQASVWNGVYAAVALPFLVHAIRLAVVHGTTHPVTTAGLLIDSLGSTAAVMLLFLGIWSDVEHRGWAGLRENLIVVVAGVYLGTATSALLLLGETPLFEMAVGFVFVLVFGLDTMAYFTGKTIGGPQMAPTISPNKTWTGAVGGLVGTLVIAAIFKLVPGAGTVSAAAPWWQVGAHLTWMQILWLGFTVGVLGQVGDLVESAFKRWAGVKDSGAILPGHGGFLDRFDSLFLSAPACYVMLAHFLHVPV
jgi:CDP-diglyceride synthetase